MAELADALDSGSNFRKEVEVQILLPAPNKNKTNPRENLEFVLFYTRDYLGLSVKFRISRISKDKGRDIFPPFNLCYRLFIDFVVYARIFYIF